MTNDKNQSDKNQSDKSKEAAHELEADENEARWEDRLKRVAKVAKDEPQGEPRKIVYKFRKVQQGGGS